MPQPPTRRIRRQRRSAKWARQIDVQLSLTLSFPWARPAGAATHAFQDRDSLRRLLYRHLRSGRPKWDARTRAGCLRWPLPPPTTEWSLSLMSVALSVVSSFQAPCGTCGKHSERASLCPGSVFSKPPRPMEVPNGVRRPIDTGISAPNDEMLLRRPGSM